MSDAFIAHLRKHDKQPQGLWTHLEEVAALSGQYAEKIGLKQAGELIGLVHDLGKASQKFDKYIRSAVGLIDPDEDGYVDASAMKGKIDHSTAGAQVIFGRLSAQGDKGSSRVRSLHYA